MCIYLNQVFFRVQLILLEGGRGGGGRIGKEGEEAIEWETFPQYRTFYLFTCISSSKMKHVSSLKTLY